jgi:ATP-dependent helicase Lhr and Lhr-like helicase
MLARADDPATLLIAPTGGGKTLAGFLPTLAELVAAAGRACTRSTSRR